MSLSLTSCANTSIQDKICTLNFYDGDNLIKTLSGKYGTKIDEDELSKLKIKENTTFKGWYRDANHSTTKENVLYFPFEESVNYYGFFANHITITLLQDDEDATYPTTYTSSDATLNYNYTYTGVEGDIIENLNLPTPSKPLYSFSGWYNREDDTLFSSRTYPGKDISLYAKFEEYPTISFVTNNSHSIDSIKVEPGTPLLQAISGLITSDTLYLDDEHKFYNWYYDEEFTSPVNLTTETMPNSSITLYAKYVSKVTIKFDTSSISSSISFEDIVCYPGEEIDPPSLVSEDQLDTSTTYFDSWYEKEEDGNFSQSPFFKDNKVMPDVEQDIVLYPKMLNKSLINIYNGSSLIATAYLKDTSSYSLDELQILDSSSSLANYIKDIETNQNKKFIGYYYLDDSSEKVFIQNSSSYIPYSDIDLYLEFDNKTTQTFSFKDPYNGSFEDLSYSISSYDIVNDPSTELYEYLKSTSNYASKDFKIAKILDSSSNIVTFPAKASDSNYTVIISSKVKITYNIYTVSNLDEVTLLSTNSINAYQDMPITYNNKEVNPITNDGTNFYVYGQKCEVDSTKYMLNKVYLSDSSEINLYTLGSSNDVSINIYFTLTN